MGIQAQDVVREGNTFTKVEVKETKTEYIYKDSKGNQYAVWLSANGKAFIKRTSSKTGKVYRQYIPEVGKKINPDAYKEKPKKDK